MLVWITAKNIPEEWTTSTQNHFMGLNLFIITSKSNIKEILVLPKISECGAYVCLKIIPSKTEFFTPHFHSFVSDLRNRQTNHEKVNIACMYSIVLTLTVVQMCYNVKMARSVVVGLMDVINM